MSVVICPETIVSFSMRVRLQRLIQLHYFIFILPSIIEAKNGVCAYVKTIVPKCKNPSQSDDDPYHNSSLRWLQCIFPLQVLTLSDRRCKGECLLSPLHSSASSGVESNDVMCLAASEWAAPLCCVSFPLSLSLSRSLSASLSLSRTLPPILCHCCCWWLAFVCAVPCELQPWASLGIPAELLFLFSPWRLGLARSRKRPSLVGRGNFSPIWQMACVAGFQKSESEAGQRFWA